VVYTTRNYIISNTEHVLWFGCTHLFGYNPLTGVQSTEFAIVVAPHLSQAGTKSTSIQSGATYICN
jgi:hypothetical protein